LPARLFFNTPIQCSLWFINRNKQKWSNARENQILFIDARKLGKRLSKTQTILEDNVISKISSTFNAWSSGRLEDEDGFCKSVNIEQIRSKHYSLVPSVYIDNALEIDDEILEFEEELEKLNQIIEKQFAVYEKTAQGVRAHFKSLGV
jgi:type I restriction enzyme M protein